MARAGCGGGGGGRQALAIHLGQPAGDILIFLTGQEEIEACCFAIADRMKALAEKAPAMSILPMYSLLNAEQQALIFQAAPEGVRKCIVSTNIAETSVTLDGILYVIDSGADPPPLPDAENTHIALSARKRTGDRGSERARSA